MRPIFFLLLFSNLLQAQNLPQPVPLTVTTYTDFSYTDVEPAYNYNFDNPVYADIWTITPGTYVPSFSNRYFMSAYGPRHLQVSTSNIGFFDFHKGADITPVVDFGGISYDADNPPNIYCVCDGEIHDIFTGPNPEATATGMYVTVKCDSTFQANPAWSNIYTAYRHLGSIDGSLVIGNPISKGDVIGVMGESGFTTNVHLHFSVIRRNTGSNINVHPMRIFDPTAASHLIDYLNTAEITQLSQGATEALFRIAIPYNKANIRAIEVNLTGTAYSKTYDYETISLLPEEDRDDNDAVAGLEFFSYPFNRGHHAYRRVWDRYEEGQIPSVYPASLASGMGNFYPFLSEDLFDTPAYVLDMRVKDLPVGYNISDLNIKIIDIWGYGVEANGTTQASDDYFAWSMINEEEKDAEEYETGTISLVSPDLDLVFDAGHGNQIVGLKFDSLQIPKDANITNAWVQFRADDSNSEATNLTFHGECNGNAAAFSTTSTDLSSRTLTTASQSWNPVAWTKGDMSADQKLTGLNDIVQEMVNKPDWTTGSPAVILISGTGKREAESYVDTNLWMNAIFYVEYDESTILPLDLLYFKGYKTPNANLLEWAIAEQKNIARIIMERSLNGVNDWLPLEIMEDEGDVEESKHYNFEDFRPPDLAYYRLKFVEITGDQEYSHIVVLDRTSFSLTNLSLRPNPINDHVNISFYNGQKEDMELRVLSSFGYEIMHLDIEAQKGLNNFLLDLSDLEVSYYFLEIGNEGRKEIRKIVKIE